MRYNTVTVGEFPPSLYPFSHVNKFFVLQGNIVVSSLPQLVQRLQDEVLRKRGEHPWPRKFRGCCQTVVRTPREGNDSTNTQKTCGSMPIVHTLSEAVQLCNGHGCDIGCGWYLDVSSSRFETDTLQFSSPITRCIVWATRKRAEGRTRGANGELWTNLLWHLVRNRHDIFS